jgi:hypothetical protein
MRNMMNLKANSLVACGALGTFTLGTFALGTFALMTGCTAKSVDLGDNTPPAVLGASHTDYQGDWEGYAEAYRWDDGSDRIRLSLDGAGHGVLEVGDSDPLPAPSADAGYPESGGESFLMHAGYHLRAGFSYPVIDPVVQSGRIRLKTQRAEIYEEWCALQTPVLDVPNTQNNGEDRYACLPNVGFRAEETACYLGTDEGNTNPIDCGLFVCLSACACTESSCAASAAEPDLVLDAALDDNGEVLEGTLLENGERITVRMTLQD